jgi:hypothetical protein
MSCRRATGRGDEFTERECSMWVGGVVWRHESRLPPYQRTTILMVPPPRTTFASPMDCFISVGTSLAYHDQFLRNIPIRVGCGVRSSVIRGRPNSASTGFCRGRERVLSDTEPAARSTPMTKARREIVKHSSNSRLHNREKSAYSMLVLRLTYTRFGVDNRSRCDDKDALQFNAGIEMSLDTPCRRQVAYRDCRLSDRSMAI